MNTRFDIGQKVYCELPDTTWGWVEKIVITRDRITYFVRFHDGRTHYKVESALRATYERERTEKSKE